MEKKEKISFETALKKLENIVEKLETGEVALEETIKLFEEGMKLVNFCNKKLEEVKHKVEIIVRNKDGFTLKPFEQDNYGNEKDKDGYMQEDNEGIEEIKDEDDELPF